MVAESDHFGEGGLVVARGFDAADLPDGGEGAFRFDDEADDLADAPPADETVAAYLGRRTGVAPANVELEAATIALSTGEDGADDRYADALERWLADLDPKLGDDAVDQALRHKVRQVCKRFTTRKPVVMPFVRWRHG